MQENSTYDKATALTLRLIETVFNRDPDRFALTVAFGLMLSMLVKAVPVLNSESITRIIDIPNISWIFYVLLSYSIANFRSFKSPRLGREIEEAFATIRRAKAEGKLTEIQVKQQYLGLINQVIARVELDRETIKQGNK